MPKNRKKIREMRYANRDPLERYARDIFGSLSSKEVEGLQSLRRAGFSYRRIKMLTGKGIGTIWKYTHMITQEVVLDPHESIQDSLGRLGGISPRPSSIPPIPSQVTPVLSQVTETRTVFEGTLEVSIARPAVPFRLTVPANSRSTIVSVTAQGAPFFIQLISPQQTASFPLGVWHPNPWKSTQRVSKIITEFGLPEVGVWYLTFWKAIRSTDHAINAAIRMTTTSLPSP